MKKIILFLLLLISFLFGNNIYACETTYCSTNAINLLKNGYENALNKNYENAIFDLEEYLQKYNYTENANVIAATEYLYYSYSNYGTELHDKGEYEKSIQILKKSLDRFSNDFSLNYNIGITYSAILDYENSLKYFKIALNLANSEEYKNLATQRIQELENFQKIEKIKNQIGTNDLYVGYQYYLNDLNIQNAWKKVTNNNEVIVAVIDDGIDINHPDLQGKIWNNQNAKYGDNKIIDFSNDTTYYGQPAGAHGTLVSGIIAANKNNNIGISGIANNVKIMPIKVFDINEKSFLSNVGKGIKYAIENNANIINLSLAGNHFSYSSELDAIIKEAYDKGIIVVIGAGNGDVLSPNKSIGINLDNNPVSPVCNNSGSTKYSIGVSATSKDGYKASWTNYGKCALYFAPGETIISTSIPAFNDSESYYTMSDGTSFSTPIISGIIALGFNQFGKVDPDLVQLALSGSYTEKTNSSGNFVKVLDAEKYIENLGRLTNQNTNIGNVNPFSEQAFQKLENHFKNLSEIEKKKTYAILAIQLNNIKNKYFGNTRNLIDDLIIILEEKSK